MESSLWETDPASHAKQHSHQSHTSHFLRPVIQIQSSQIVSRSKSPLLSAPQTLHLFLLSWPASLASPLPLPPSNPPLLLPSLSIAAFNFAIASLSLSTASAASCSASGESGIVSREEMDGERLRNDVGVLGTDDTVLTEYAYEPESGYDSLYLAGEMGDEAPRSIGLEELVCSVAGDLRSWCTLSGAGRRCCSGEDGRRRMRGNVAFGYDPLVCCSLSAGGRGRGAMSSSEFSDMVWSMSNPEKEDSSRGRRRGEARRLEEYRGDAGRARGEEGIDGKVSIVGEV